MIDVEVNAGIAVIRMNHGKANAMDLEFCRSLTETLNHIDSGEVRAAILTGNDRVFSAGVDLVALLDGGPESSNRFCWLWPRSRYRFFRSRSANCEHPRIETPISTKPGSKQSFLRFETATRRGK